VRNAFVHKNESEFWDSKANQATGFSSQRNKLHEQL